MTPDESRELQELIAFLKENKINEFDFERGDLKLRIKFESQTREFAALLAEKTRSLEMLAEAHSSGAAADVSSASNAPPSASSASGSSEQSAAAEEAGLHTVKSPIVGTFYESPSPGPAAFVKIGDSVESGQVLCIVEAMKLMNEIEADAAGEIVKRLVNSGQPVEYGQPLFVLRPH